MIQRMIALAIVLTMSAGHASGQTTTTASARVTSATAVRGPVPPPLIRAAGRRIPQTSATVFLSDAVLSDTAKAPMDVVFFLHGNAEYARMFFSEAKLRAALVTSQSKNYAGMFGDCDSAIGFFDDAFRSIRSAGFEITTESRVAIVSFSGGEAGIRFLLNCPKVRARVTDVVLADSLYPRRLGPPPGTLSQEDLRPFIEFAREAAAISSTETSHSFVFSHLYPPEPTLRTNTTTRAAQAIIAALKLEETTSTLRNRRGQRVAYEARRGGTVIRGVWGMTTQDHFEHFYGMADLLQMTGIRRLDTQ